MRRAVEQEQHYLQKLPNECWEKILSPLNDSFDWESLSLTCKKFLSLTNTSRVSLSLSGRIDIHILYKLLERYPNLRKLRIFNLAHLDANNVLVIAQSNLKLEELELCFSGRLQTDYLVDMGSRFKLKVLKLFCAVSNADLIRIADAFPLLEEFRIQNNDRFGKVAAGVAIDEGIHYLSSNLKRLQTMELNHQYISDKSLVSLASNCAFLEHFMVDICPEVGESLRVTYNGISFLIQNSPHLKSLVVTGMLEMGCFGAKSSANVPKNLQTLKFKGLNITDEFLYSITEARISLTHLHLNCEGYTYTGIWKLLNSYRSLKTLVLCGVQFLTNECIDKLSPFMHNLTSIQLWSCPLLSDSAFVMLTQTCPLLCRIDMSGTDLGKEEYEYDKINLKNFAVKFLGLPMNKYLSTSTLRRLLSICPKVEKLSLCHSFKSNDRQLDVADVLECSRELLDVDVSFCKLKFTRKCTEFSMIENFTAMFSDMNDEGLVALSKTCPRLLNLRLNFCGNVTEAGVKEVMRSCKRLRSLSIGSCNNLDKGIIDWIESNCPSLTRRISMKGEEILKMILQCG